MKIVISGSAGTGKTTLARLLSEHYGCSYIHEGYEAFFVNGGEFIQPVEKLKALIMSVLEEKHYQEIQAGNFVSDRCPIDLFNLWLSRGFSIYQEETTHLYQRCRTYVSNYDAVVVLPWGMIALQQTQEKETRRRVMNPWIQFHNHSTIVGLTSQWLSPDKIVPIPGQIKDNKQRMEFVIKALESKG